MELTREEYKYKYVQLEWVRENLSGFARNVSQHNADYAARGYLIYLLGCTIFANKSGRLVPVKFLILLEDLDSVRTYAWGAAVLAFLYRQLGIASRSGIRQMTGYISLVEAWWYEYFSFERPLLNPNYDRITESCVV